MDRDAIIFDLAARQHGIVTRHQLVAAGISTHTIDHRVRGRRLVRLHSGVYRVGPVRSPWEAEMAAVLACGPESAISHDSAGSLWELNVILSPDSQTHVSTAGGTLTAPGVVRLHRVRSWLKGELAQRHGVPVTSVARTLIDLAGRLHARELERALATAERQRLVAPEEVRTLMEHHAHRRGMAALRRLMDGRFRSELTRSEAEAHFLTLVRSAALRPPAANRKVRGYEVDFLWRSERLVVEIDGFAYHSTRGAFEHDRTRDAVLIAAGLRVMRITWRQIIENPHTVVARVAQALVHAST